MWLNIKLIYLFKLIEVADHWFDICFLFANCSLQVLSTQCVNRLIGSTAMESAFTRQMNIITIGEINEFLAFSFECIVFLQYVPCDSILKVRH